MLDVGCGQAKYPGATGFDISPETQADLVVDLNESPYPIESDSFECQPARFFKLDLNHLQKSIHDMKIMFAIPG